MKKAGRGTRDGRRIQSVDRAVEILDRLVAAPNGLALGELSAAVGLPPQTVQGLLRTLEAQALVTQAGRAAPYHLGSRIGEWHRRWWNGQDRAPRVRELVFALSRRIGEYVLLAELRGSHAIGLAEARSDQPLNVSGETGSFACPHRMSTGKVLLAYLPPERLAAVLEDLKAADRDLSRQAVVRRLNREILDVRRQGFATNVLKEMAIASIAVPVFGPGREVAAALGASAPLVRFGETRRAELRDALREAAREVARAWFGGAER